MVYNDRQVFENYEHVFWSYCLLCTLSEFLRENKVAPIAAPICAIRRALSHYFSRRLLFPFGFYLFLLRRSQWIPTQAIPRFFTLIYCLTFRFKMW